MLKAWTPFFVGVLLGCGSAPTVPPELLISTTPSRFTSDGHVVWVQVSATDAHGKPGTGTVTVEATAGTLAGGGVVTLDTTGSGSVAYTCNAATETACLYDQVSLHASWKTGDKTVVADHVLLADPAASSCDGSALVGSWKRSDGLTWVLKATQCAISGTADTTLHHHVGSGTYVPSTKTASFQVTRTALTGGCVTVMTESIAVVDATHLTISCTGTDGKCDLPANFTETATYVKQ